MSEEYTHLTELRRAIGKRLGMDGDHVNFQDYVVGNLYPGAAFHIGDHSDKDELWGSTSGENVILTYSLNGSGVFFAKPDTGTDRSLGNLMDGLWDVGVTSKNPLTKAINLNLTTLVLQPPNALLVMGGFFQGQMTHGTLSHNMAGYLGCMVRGNLPTYKVEIP